MKPGNRQMYGANSCRIVIFSPERWGSNKIYAAPSSEGAFKLFAAKKKEGGLL